MTLDELEAEAMKLDLAARIELVRRLTASVPTPPAPTETPQTPPPEAPKVLSDDERERLWLQEAMRRSREMKERQLKTQPPQTPRGAASKSAAPARRKPRPGAKRRKPQPKPVRARVKRAKARPKARPKAAKRRPKPRTRPRSRR